MGVFKPAYEYESLVDFMKDRLYQKFNKGRGGVTAIELRAWLSELNIRFNKSASRDKLFELLIANNVTLTEFQERFPQHYGVIKNDYVERFGITDNEYNRLKKTGFLKEVGHIATSNYSCMTAFDSKQYFEMTEEELRAAIPPGRNVDPEKARLAREKGLTCVRCGKVQTHYSRINKDKVCSKCEEKEYEAIRLKSYVDQCNQFLNDDKYVILDTETTGLYRHDEVIELAVLDMKGNTLYESVFNPSQTIPVEATRVHGIDDEMVKDAPKFVEEWGVIWDIIKDKTVLIYNAKFDINMIYQTLEINKVTFGKGFKTYCVMEFYKDFIDSRRWVSLSNACSEMNISIKQNHRAISDCEMVLELIKAIADKAE